VNVDVRISRGLALAAWAAFFTVLWATGEADRYLGARTTWVVPFGAVLTGATALVLLARGRSGVALSRGEAWGTLTLIAPILAVLTIPHAELGAAAAERRATSPAVAKRLVKSKPRVSGLSYAHVMAAQGPVPQPGVRPGVQVRLVGFVMRRPGTRPGLFQVARFFITCCIADAMPLYVTVDPPQAVPPRDAWVVVSGPLERRRGELIIAAEEVTRIRPPAHPYLGSSGPVDVPSVRHGTRPPDPRRP
jgi:uncharacterized repeat protein (TIGR03943 family)